MDERIKKVLEIYRRTKAILDKYQKMKLLRLLFLLLPITMFGQNVRISDMPSVTDLTNAFIPVAQGNTNKKAPSILFSPNGQTAAPATTGTIAVTLTAFSSVTIVPTGACTFNASGGISGQRCAFIITTSGTSAFTLTWNTNFKTTGTLSTGIVSGKVFTVEFVYDGTNWNEIARTTAM